MSEQYDIGIDLGYLVPPARRLPHPLQTSHCPANLCLFSLEVNFELDVNLLALTLFTMKVVHTTMADWLYHNWESAHCIL